MKNYEYISDKTSFKEEHYITEDTLYLSDISRFLSNKEYSIFKLKYIDGYLDKEIANLFHITRQAVNKTLHKKKIMGIL